MVTYENSKLDEIDASEEEQLGHRRLAIFIAILIILLIGIFVSVRLLRRGSDETGQATVSNETSEDSDVTGSESSDTPVRNGRFDPTDVTRDRYNVDPDSRYELDVEDTTLMHLALTSFTARAKYVKGSDAWQLRLYGMCKNIGQVDSDWRGLPNIKICGKEATLELTDGFIRKGASHEWSAVATVPASELTDKMVVEVGDSKGSFSLSAGGDAAIEQEYTIDGEVTDEVCKTMAEWLVVAQAYHELDMEIADETSGSSEDYTILDERLVVDGDDVRVLGSIRNNRQEASELAGISVFFLDKNDNIVDVGVWNHDRIDAGEIVDFEIKPMSVTEGIVGYKFGEIFM